MYYEPTKDSWLDLIPIIGSLREAKKMDENPSVNQGIALGTSVASDALGFGVVGGLAKLATRVNKYRKLLKARGFNPITTDGSAYIKIGQKTTPVTAGEYGVIGTKTTPYVVSKAVPPTNPLVTYIKGLRPNGVDVAGATAAGALGWGAGEYEAKKKK